jgi:hypothetical protein
VFYYGTENMDDCEGSELLSWYERKKDRQTDETFDNTLTLESYEQKNVPVLREACGAIRKLFPEIRNTKIFLESLTIASACILRFSEELFCNQIESGQLQLVGTQTVLDRQERSYVFSLRGM